MKKLLFYISILFLISCNPCRKVAKHPECFPADTVTKKEYVITHEKVYITEDSIIYDTIPCDPVIQEVVVPKIIYKTVYKTRTDTIRTEQKISKINPVNTELQNENTKIKAELQLKKNKLKKKNKILIGASGLILLLIGALIWFIKI